MGRVSAFEVKFVIDPSLAQRVREWARARLPADPYGLGPHSDEYVTTSLYFDTAERDVLYRHGSYGRSKYRIRRYGRADVVYLERKMRRSTVLAKRRSTIPLDDLWLLADTDRPADWAGRWFSDRISARALQPVCQISYRRTARVGTTEYGPVRLTLDEAVHAARVGEYAFCHRVGSRILDRQVVLELKYRFTPPTVFKQLIEEFALTPRRVSKYRLGMSALVGDAASRTQPDAPAVQLLTA